MNLPASQTKIVSPTLMLSGNEARAYAQDLAKSELLSTFFQGSVENVMFAMELGKIYNLEPAALLQNVHVFETYKDGVKSLKASLSANLMVYLARQAGHIVTTKANANKATCTIVRGDTIFAKMLRGDISADELEHYSKILTTLKEMDMDPKAYAVTESVWTMDKAHTAGLVKDKGNWVKYPHAMLPARAKADCVRLACEEVLINMNNAAAMIGGGFVAPDGSPISTSWTHLADELGGSINEDDGSFVPLERVDQRQARPQAATARPQAAPSRPDATAKADIAAQAGVDPSRAGWGGTRKEAPAPAPEPTPEPEEDAQVKRVATYVQTQPFEETLKLIGKSLSFPDEDRDDRLVMLCDAIAEYRSTEEILSVIRLEAEGAEVSAKIMMASLGERAEANTVADVIREVSSMDRDQEELRELILMTFNALRSCERMETPATYKVTADEDAEAVTTSLGEAVRTFVLPLMS